MRKKFVLNYYLELYTSGCSLLPCLLDLYSYAMLDLGNNVKLV